MGLGVVPPFLPQFPSSISVQIVKRFLVFRNYLATNMGVISKTNIVLIVISLLLGFFFGQYFFRRNIWTGFYYSDKDKIEDQRTWIVSPPLYSLGECQRWVREVRKVGDNYDYQCGTGCRFISDFGDTVICRTDAR